MKIEDLMIGDLIQFKKSHTAPLPTKPVQIFGITYDSKISHKHLIHIVFCESGAVQYNYNPDIFEPIPLSREILEKNYFETQELGGGRVDLWTGFGEDNQYDIEVEFREDGTIHTKIDGPTYFVSWGIKYVHEFQHALRICGVNKVITL